MKRNPSVTKRTVERDTKSRSLVTKTHIQNWFDNVQSYLSNNSLMDTLEILSRLFNTDESGLMFCPKGFRLSSTELEE